MPRESGWKETFHVNRKFGWFSPSYFSSVPLLAVFLVLALCAPCLSEDDCASSRAKWEQVFQDLRGKLQEFVTIQQTPVERVIQRPLVERVEGKSIARQVSEGLQAKEDLLNTKRQECRNMMNLENQAFNELQGCAQSSRGSKDKDAKNFVKKRQSLIEKAVTTLSEVREVEGKDSALPYSESMQQDPYSRSVNNYWQNYQQMYRQWWGQ
jgi:PBP1b-binding outer membrane lipoprotein LpoB